MTAPTLIHQALLYDDAQQYVDAILPFIRAGVDKGEPVLAVATKTNLAALRDELGDEPDVKFIDPIRWYEAPGRTIAACHRYLQTHRDGHEWVRVVGEPIWSGWDQLETASWKRFEASLNLAFASAPAWMICSYDRSTLDPDVLADARRTHPQLSSGEPIAEYADPVALCAEWRPVLKPPPEGGYTVFGFDGDPAPVRRFVGEHAPQLGLSATRTDDLVLAVNEVATNAIRHGAGFGQVRMWRDERFVLCEVYDPGHAAEELFNCVPPRPDSEGGHGLWITRQLCDRVEIRSETSGTTVRLSMRRG